MTKREKYNKKAMKRYRRRVAAKEIATYGAGMTTMVGGLLFLAEPVKDIDLIFIAIKLVSLILIVSSAVIISYLHQKEIKKPVITDRKSPTDYSKAFTELQLKYEVIEEPKK